ncbi:unnamed protein product [Phytomonas sp. Hart1]|nr:unnamed protein product [Phytomonas sp. Hart1]|eukprot:CCW67460.1 unnamed protein product [Phytomonas sp. isolate Hart1]
MEYPFFGRTGFLDAQRDGLPIGHKPRLLTKVQTVGLKWSPSLLTCPQRLLHHFSQGGGVDDSLFRYLRLSYIVELLAGKGKQDSANRAALMRGVLRWKAKEKCSTSSLTEVQCYPPELTVVVVKDGKSVGAIAKPFRRAVTLLGKDHTLNDVFLDHPSCSAQHAALTVEFSLPFDIEEDMTNTLVQHPLAGNASECLLTTPGASDSLEMVCSCLSRRLVDLEDEQREAAGEENGGVWSLELRIMDLGATNGTFLNHERLSPYTAVALMEGDVITFGSSTRNYVVMRATQ